MNSKTSLERGTFWASSFVIIFLVGGVFGYKGWQPIRFVQENYSNLINIMDEVTKVRPELLEPIRTNYPQIIPELESASPGYTLIQGIFKEGVQIKLVNLAGETVNTWDADLFSIWPDPGNFFPEKIFPKSRFNYHSQGVWALSDGSVIVNFFPGGLVKLDRCGKLVWKLERMTHHSVTPTVDGQYWVPVAGSIQDLEDSYILPGVSAAEIMESGQPYGDSVLLVDENGSVVKEFPILKALFDSDFKHQLYDVNLVSPNDPTHVNDIEVVTPELAAKISGVETGDLLVSMRQMHMLLIMDGATGKVKWFKQGPWIRQHDPDITESGKIVVFNNEQRLFSDKNHKASSIVIFDPGTGQTAILFSGTNQQPFYSRIMGTQQLLPNGNILIAESMTGRVFELNSNLKKIVWEWKMNYDETHAAIIESAIRYNINYFQVENWNCS